MRFKLLLLVVLICATFYKLLPVYHFFSHKDVLPLIPWGKVTIPANVPAQSEVFDPGYKDIAKEADALLRKHRQTISAPGITAAVAIDGSLIWQSAAGWADIDDNRAMTPCTQLRIGSTSKALTSAGLARLVMMNKVTLDTPLKNVFEPLPNPAWADITPRQLASHMAGIPHYGENTEMWGLFKSMTLDSHYEHVEDAVALFDQSELLSVPGERFEYSSLGTVLLSRVMEIAAGESYQQWMHQQVFKPLKLKRTTEEQNATQLATFYKHGPDDSLVVYPWRNVDLSHRLAGGGWVSTSADLALLAQGFMAPEFISEHVREAFWTPQQLNNGQVNEQQYAIGWRRHQMQIGGKQVDYLHHGGVSRGAQSFLVAVPEYGLSLAVNINSKTENFSDFGKIAGELIRAFVAQKT